MGRREQLFASEQELPTATPDLAPQPGGAHAGEEEGANSILIICRIPDDYVDFFLKREGF